MCLVKIKILVCFVILALMVSSIPCLNSMAYANEDTSTRDFEPGSVLVGFKEPYKGSFSSEEFPGLNVTEAIDLKLRLYESLLKLYISMYD